MDAAHNKEPNPDEGTDGSNPKLSGVVAIEAMPPILHEGTDGSNPNSTGVDATESLIGFALITGGASGIGRATAELLVREGFNVAILDLPTSKGQDVADVLGPGCIFIPGDVTNAVDVSNCIDTIKTKFGHLNVLVNSAGIYKFQGVDHSDYMETFDSVHKVNIRGMMQVIYQALPLMKAADSDEEGGRGAIVNFASIAATDGSAGGTAYSTSKGSVVALTLPLAREFSEFGIRVNCVLPGAIDTPLLAEAPSELLQVISSKQAFPKTLGRAGDVADLILFLIRNRFMNAASVRIDGGFRS